MKSAHPSHNARFQDGLKLRILDSNFSAYGRAGSSYGQAGSYSYGISPNANAYRELGRNSCPDLPCLKHEQRPAEVILFRQQY